MNARAPVLRSIQRISRRRAGRRGLCGGSAGRIGGCQLGRRSGHDSVGRSNDGHHVVNRNRFTFLHSNLDQDAGSRRGNFCVHLVGRDFQQRLVSVDAVADLLHPPDDSALGDRFAHLGHHDLGGHDSCPFATNVTPRRAWRAPPRPRPRPWSGAHGSCESDLRP